MDRAAVRPAPRVRAAALDRGADRPRPARDRRRGVGQADVGRPEPHRRGPPVHAQRPDGEPWYPLELVRAVALLWLFAGLRVDEILRLRVGAIRWQHRHADAGDGGRRCVCSTFRPTRPRPRSPSRSTGPSATRSRRGRRVRPAQPQFADRKTGELVDMLLAYRGAQLGEKYVNRVLIPLLCRKAGVPREDVRGQITGHRARATIASQLYNAKDPMTLFELQAWLGHRSPQLHPALRADHPDHADQGLHRRRLLRPQRPRDRGAARPRRDHRPAPPATASRSSSTTSGTATAPTASSSNARTGWRAPAATSTSPSSPARRSCSKPRTGCSGCSSRSRSPTTSAPRSKATKTRSTGSIDRLADDADTGRPDTARARATRPDRGGPRRRAPGARLMPTADSPSRTEALIGSRLPCSRIRRGCLSPDCRRPVGRALQGRPLPSPRPRARFRVRPPAGLRALSTTGSPQGGNQDERLSPRRQRRHPRRQPHRRPDPQAARRRTARSATCASRSTTRDDQPMFIDVATFGAQAEACAKYLTKGRAIAVTGRLVYREWVDDDGTRRSRHAVVGRVQFGGAPRRPARQRHRRGRLNRVN